VKNASQSAEYVLFAEQRVFSQSGAIEIVVSFRNFEGHGRKAQPYQVKTQFIIGSYSGVHGIQYLCIIVIVTRTILDFPVD